MNSLVEFSIEEYDFFCRQKEGETLKDFSIRAQKELDRLNVPITIKV